AGGGEVWSPCPPASLRTAEAGARGGSAIGRGRNRCGFRARARRPTEAAKEPGTERGSDQGWLRERGRPNRDGGAGRVAGRPPGRVGRGGSGAFVAAAVAGADAAADRPDGSGDGEDDGEHVRGDAARAGQARERRAAGDLHEELPRRPRGQGVLSRGASPLPGRADVP